MDPSQRPLGTTYYPSPPSHDDHSSYSRTYPAAMPYPPPRESMPPPPPTPMSTTTITSPAMPVQPSHPMAPSVNGSADRAPIPAKQNRLSKACDGCSVRKVKCDEEGPPCRACRSLQIPCTFNRPSRRRGPPNRHAEAIKKQKLEYDAIHPNDTKPNGSPTAWDVSPNTSFASPVAFTNGYGQSRNSTAESICPFDLLVLLVDDFFVYIHPIHPFPHEPSFRQALLRDRQDTQDPRFLALLASMIGALVATYPRRPLKRLNDFQRKDLFHSSLDFVNRCRDIAVEARGPGLFGRREISNVDAATSYFLGHMATNTFSILEGELYFGECFNMLRAMGYQRYNAEPDTAPARQTEFGQAPSMPQHADLIEREVAHRIYWALYTVIRSAFTFAFGSSVSDIHFNPSTPLRRHPPFPVEVDDSQIFPDRIEAPLEQPSHTLAAFNTICKMHMAYEPIKAWKLSWAVDERLDRDKQNSLYLRCVSKAEAVMEESVSPEFSVGSPPPPVHPGSAIPGKLWEQQQRGQGRGGIISPTMSSGPHFVGINGSAHEFEDVAARRRIGTEIQKANLHVTHLTARSFYLEKYWNSNNMAVSVIGKTPDQLQMERLSLARRMLDILSQVHPIYMEPNSFGFCMKIRQVASTLYAAASSFSDGAGSSDTKGEARSEGEQDPKELAQAYVNEFLQILMGLEKGSRSTGQRRVEGWGEGDEEEELRAWADVRRGLESGEVRGDVAPIAPVVVPKREGE